jgi:hypothetical protein
MRKKASINVLTLKRSYVYVIHVDGVVRYIGKGSNGRMYAHMKEVKLRLTRKFNLQSISPPFQRKLTEAVMRGAVVEEIVLADNLTSKQAYKVEYRHLKELVYAGKRQQLWNVIPHTIYTPEEYKAYVSRLIQNLTSKDRWIRYFSHNHLMRLGTQIWACQPGSQRFGTLTNARRVLLANSKCGAPAAPGRRSRHQA